jgi:predicted CoA-binding protein
MEGRAGSHKRRETNQRPVGSPQHLEPLAMQPRPAVVWLQKGVSHPGFVAALRAEGFAVVENRCMMEDRRTFGLSAPARG